MMCLQLLAGHSQRRPVRAQLGWRTCGGSFITRPFAFHPFMIHRQLLAAIKRSQFKELAASVLKDRKLRKSTFGAPFHVLDLLGGSLVTPITSTSGLLLRAKSA